MHSINPITAQVHRSGRLVITNLTTQEALRVIRFVKVTFDQQADQTVERLGVDRVMSALDRATAPATV
jgi:hypothetical protein